MWPAIERAPICNQLIHAQTELLGEHVRTTPPRGSEKAPLRWSLASERRAVLGMWRGGQSVFSESGREKLCDLCRRVLCLSRAASRPKRSADGVQFLLLLAELR